MFFEKKQALPAKFLFSLLKKHFTSQNPRYNYLSERKESRGKERKKEGNTKKIQEMGRIFTPCKL